MLCVKFMRLIAVVLVCVVICVGCHRASNHDGGQPSAKKIFTDPRQLRLAEAVEQGDSKAIAEALRLAADIDEPGRAGIRMLMWAMLAGSVDGFNALLDRDANLMAKHFNPDIMRPGQKTYTVAEHVCVFRDKRFLEVMLAKGFDPNRIVDHDARETMLYHAIYRHDHEAVSRLINAGARVNWKNAYERGALDLAISLRDYRIAMQLYSFGADPLVRDQTGFNVVDSLKRYGSRGVTPDQRPYFDEFIAALESRGLITWNDITEADKPRTPNAGVTIVEHGPQSKTGRAIKEMESKEREFRRRESQ
jgi:ankyrin repeat protein